MVSFLLIKIIETSKKKGTLKIQKSKIVILVLNQCPISVVFQIVQLPGDQKTAITGESLHMPADIEQIYYFSRFVKIGKDVSILGFSQKMNF